MILGYCRVSTLEQAADDRTSLETQENVIRGYAMSQGVDQFGVQIYVDKGISGGVPLRQRPSGSALMADVRPGDTVIASKLDRIFRSASDAVAMLEHFEENQIKLVLFDMGSSPITENGVSQLIFTVLAAVAAFERKRITERITDGKLAKKAKGGHIGGHVPYGYSKVDHGREAHLVPNPVEMAVISFARELATGNDITPRDIARRLTEKGMVARNGKPFHDTQVARMLNAPVLQ